MEPHHSQTIVVEDAVASEYSTELIGLFSEFHWSDQRSAAMSNGSGLGTAMEGALLLGCGPTFSAIEPKLGLGDPAVGFDIGGLQRRVVGDLWEPD